MKQSILGYRLLMQLMPDANTGGGSSNLPDDNGQGSSPEPNENGDKPEGEEVPTEEQPTEGSEPPTEEEQEPVEGEKETPKEEVADAIVDKPEDSKLDFNKHPRFQELIKEKNSYKTEIDSLKPMAQRAQALDQYCQQNGVNEQQIARALQYYALLNSDPMKAFDMIRADYQQLATFAGELLPPDLQAKVAAGTLEPEMAKELAQNRARQQHTQWRGTQQGVNQQQQNMAAVDATINIWAQQKQSIDPDLKPGSPVWKYLDAQIRNARTAQANLTPQQVPQLVESLYKEAKEMFKSLAPKPKSTKPSLNGNRNNNGNASAVIKTPEDVAKAVLRGMKPAQFKYS
jgi:hypothetical protein